MRIAVDTLNKFAVGATPGGTIAILNIPLQALQADDVRRLRWPAVAPLTVSEALNLAAWLVAVSGRREEFGQVLDAIERL